MAQIKEKTKCATMIGDLVQSKASDRQASHQSLIRALANEDIAKIALESPQPTAGDEIQGKFSTIGKALHATHLIRLHLLAQGFDMRFGIGWGETKLVDAKLNIQDGSAWWNARAAIEKTEKLSETAGNSGIRTTVIGAAHTELLNPHLHLIDSHLSAINSSTAATLLGLIHGAKNFEIAKELGVSSSAISQRINNNNLKPLSASMQALWLIK